MKFNSLKKPQKSLPYDWYFQQDVYEKEIKNIFTNDWIYVCHTDSIKTNHYRTLQLDKKNIVIIKNKKNEISLFYNTCSHRGSQIFQNEEGIIIYLPQEGRDIGLINKIRAYKLQEDGLDTVDANLTLGFRDDERSYDVAVAILKKLNFKKINLITNNPNKVKKLNDEGLEVMKIIKLKIEPNEINKEYLNIKKIKSNHIFD